MEKGKVQTGANSMSQISRDTYRKLVLLYLVGKFPDGVYTSYRFQKVMYFSTKSSEHHPFEYRHTQYGQYSYNARRIQDSLVWLGLLKQTDLGKENEGNGAKWELGDNEASHILAEILPAISPDLAESISHNVSRYGFLESKDLVNEAESDDLLAITPLGRILLNEDIPPLIEIPLDEDESEDIELSLNENFLIAMDKIVEAVETTEFDWGEVKSASVL